MNISKIVTDMRNLEEEIDTLVGEVIGCGKEPCSEICPLQNEDICYGDMHTTGKLRLAIRVLQDRAKA